MLLRLHFEALRWPSPATAVANVRNMWKNFIDSFTPHDRRIWAERRYRAPTVWNEAPPAPATPVRLYYWNGQPIVLSAVGLALGILETPLSPRRLGLFRATVSQHAGRIDISHLGPDDLWVV